MDSALLQLAMNGFKDRLSPKTCTISAIIQSWRRDGHVYNGAKIDIVSK